MLTSCFCMVVPTHFVGIEAKLDMDSRLSSCAANLCFSLQRGERRAAQGSYAWKEVSARRPGLRPAFGHGPPHLAGEPFVARRASSLCQRLPSFNCGSLFPKFLHLVLLLSLHAKSCHTDAECMQTPGLDCAVFGRMLPERPPCVELQLCSIAKFKAKSKPKGIRKRLEEPLRLCEMPITIITAFVDTGVVRPRAYLRFGTPKIRVSMFCNLFEEPKTRLWS